MTWTDTINGLYEALAGIFLFFSCLKLYKDKEVKGWSLSTQIFFTSWGYWNLFYYANLNQWMSWLGGILVVIFNTTWTSMAVYYTRYYTKKSKQNDEQSELQTAVSSR